MISIAGEVLGEPFTAPVAYARALLELVTGAFPSDRIVLIEHNEESMQDARADAAAAAIIDEIDALFVEGGEPIEPPDDRGRAPWGAWVKLVRDAVPVLDARNMGPWLEAQRPVLVRAPMSHNVLALKATNARAVEVRHALPE